MNMKLQILREEIVTTRQWHDVMLAAHNAYMAMGTFQNPLDDTLNGVTHGEWQLEIARRITLAVIDKLVEQVIICDGGEKNDKKKSIKMCNMWKKSK